jgi:hypothetical protein
MIMKANWFRTVILSAAALTMGSVAYGQSRLIADIPFSFRMHGTEMPAGRYWVEPNTLARTVVRLTDGNNQQLAMGIGATGHEQSAPRLIFSCRESSGCSLAEVWTGNGTGVVFPQPKLTSAEKERLAAVILHRSEAE